MIKSLESRGERGSIAILAAVGAIALAAFLALVADVGYMMLTKSQLQNTADSAVSSGVLELGRIYSRLPAGQNPSQYTLSASEKATILGSINDYAQRNPAAHVAISINPDDVVFGRWDAASQTISETDTGVNAVYLSARRDDDNNGSVATLLASVVGIDNFSVRADAAAALLGAQEVPEGTMQLPVGIADSWFESNDNPCDCENPIQLYPNDGDSCTTWHTYDEGTGNEEGVEEILDALYTDDYTSPECKARHSRFEFVGDLDPRTPPPGDGDSDSGIDRDGDGDTDSDSVGPDDHNGNSDSDGNSDSGNDRNGDGDSDSVGDSDSHIDRDLDGDTDSDGDSGIDRDGERDRHNHGDSDSRHSDNGGWGDDDGCGHGGDSDSACKRDVNIEADGDSDSENDCDSDSHIDRDHDGDTDSDSDGPDDDSDSGVNNFSRRGRSGGGGDSDRGGGGDSDRGGGGDSDRGGGGDSDRGGLWGDNRAGAGNTANCDTPGGDGNGGGNSRGGVRDGDSDRDDDSDSGIDRNHDGDSDSEGDSDSGIDRDGDGDSDSEADSDSGIDRDNDGNSDSEVDCHAPKASPSKFIRQVMDLYVKNRDEHGEWEVQVPVYHKDDCWPVSGEEEVVGIATIAITEVSAEPGDERIEARSRCKVLSKGRGGGPDYGTAVVSPKYVKCERKDGNDGAASESSGSGRGGHSGRRGWGP